MSGSFQSLLLLVSLVLFHLLSPQRGPLKIFCWAGSLFMNSFSCFFFFFCLRNHLSFYFECQPFWMKTSQLHIFMIQHVEYILPCFSGLQVSVDRSAANLICLPLQVKNFYSLVVFKILFLSCVCVFVCVCVCVCVCEFEYAMHCRQLVFVESNERSLCFLDFDFCVLPQIRNVFCYNLLT